MSVNERGGTRRPPAGVPSTRAEKPLEKVTSVAVGQISLLERGQSRNGGSR